jgi:hypothetical protein
LRADYSLDMFLIRISMKVIIGTEMLHMCTG